MCPISYSNTRPNTWRIFKASRQYNWEDFGKLGLCNMASQLVYWSGTFCWFGGSRNLIFVATQLKQRRESSWIIFLSFRVRRSLWNTTYPPVPPKYEGWNLNAAPMLLLVQMMFPFPFVLFVKALFTTLSITGCWITGTLWSRLIWDVYRFLGIMSNLGNNCPKSRFIGIPQRKNCDIPAGDHCISTFQQYEKTQQILPIYKKFFRTYPTTPKEWAG